MFEEIKILAILPFLLYASYSDLTTRRVSNDVWKGLLYVGFIFIMAETALNGVSYLSATIISFIVMFALQFVLWRLGAFGGADVKAMAIIALIVPMIPEIAVGSITLPFYVSSIGIFAFGVFCNAVILTLVGYWILKLLKHESATIPFIASITGGYITAIIFGDFINHFGNWFWSIL